MKTRHTIWVVKITYSLVMCILNCVEWREKKSSNQIQNHNINNNMMELTWKKVRCMFSNCVISKVLKHIFVVVPVIILECNLFSYIQISFLLLSKKRRRRRETEWWDVCTRYVYKWICIKSAWRWFYLQVNNRKYTATKF